jgi:hypothetical protein
MPTMPTNPATLRLARASLATFATLTLAACSDSTGPRDRVPDPDMSEQAGYLIASELLTSLGSLNPDVAMTSPAAPLLVNRAATVRDPRLVAARLATAPEDCGTFTPALPADGDDDGIPDALTVTYTLPDCHIEDEFGSMDITGSMFLEDLTPTVAGMSFGLAMNAVRVAVTDPEFGTITVTRDGTGSVDHAASHLDQLYDFSTLVRAQGVSASFATEWDLDFDAAPGSSIVAGEPLPDGTYTPSGTTIIEQMRDRYTFIVSAPTPLAYSATCAADPFMYDNPFSAGILRVDAAGAEGEGYVEIVFADCLEPTITYRAADVL